MGSMNKEFKNSFLLLQPAHLIRGNLSRLSILMVTMIIADPFLLVLGLDMIDTERNRIPNAPEISFRAGMGFLVRSFPSPYDQLTEASLRTRIRR
jgi:hypothetical protein